MGRCSMFMDRRIQYCQDVISSQQSVNSIQHWTNPSKLTHGYQQIGPKVYVEKQKDWVTNRILEEESRTESKVS